MPHSQLLENYLAGPDLLRNAVSGMTAEQLDATPISGKWSSRQVVCHIADFETVYADRIKRIIAEENPPLPSGDPDLFAAQLCYQKRDVENELQLITVVRQQLAQILQNVSNDTFQRTGQHSQDGALSIKELLTRITGHIPHHVQFINDKRNALGL